MDGETPIAEMKNISKSFGEVQALKNVDFNVGQNEVVGLVGDNGAGKTTLIKILTGVYKPDEGEIYYKGNRVKFSSPAESRDLGIEPVHQKGTTIAEMQVWENFFLGRELRKNIGPFKFLDKEKMKQVCRETLKEIGIDISPEAELGNLSGGEAQSVAIGRSMYFGGELLVMDEPTASLSLKETEKVLKYIRGAKEQGYSIILISHLTRHVYPAADRFVILEKGEKIGDFEKSEITRKELEKTIVSGRLEVEEIEHEKVPT
ncbi:hypothetical protein AKJ62_00365 [candidate division MSBL1 archaeon SCGC-AAA259D14]|uniref:ABC transporter domain-containing protein n=2 Tax=candidate division MSBL1 TaxID=215777 RepID=A0A133U8Z3_9EURY|nr:hypothetical protein AKJ62_00365 [candidate division MSBL1 archaeon SCGC-AAA259D14]KXA93851.1 hypothetical protein AKJ66_00765 [candidate division MSBL1 archaeon SCGC-AAA259E22]